VFYFWRGIYGDFSVVFGQGDLVIALFELFGKAKVFKDNSEFLIHDDVGWGKT
jgi:hypothetical protein